MGWPGTKIEPPTSILQAHFVVLQPKAPIHYRANKPHQQVARPASPGSSTTANADVCTFRIAELCQHAAKILLGGRHREANTFTGHYVMELLNVRHGEAEFHLAGWGFIRCGM